MNERKDGQDPEDVGPSQYWFVFLSDHRISFSRCQTMKRILLSVKSLHSYLSVFSLSLSRLLPLSLRSLIQSCRWWTLHLIVSLADSDDESSYCQLHLRFLVDQLSHFVFWLSVRDS